jgi:UDP-glucose 4-epimerase
MKKIAVTGGAGYIGSFIVRGLKDRGFDPVIIDDMSSGHEKAVEGFRVEKINLFTEKNKLQDLFKKEKFEGVIHMASFIQMGESFRDPAKYYENNVVGFINLMGAMNESGVKNIILSSSAGVYGNPERVPISEEDVKNPLNPYGETKYVMERILEDYDTAYGIKFMAFRYFNAAGAATDGSLGEDHPDESHLIPNIIKKALKGEEILIFGEDYDTEDGTNVRDYVHVLDLTEAHVKGLEALLTGAESDFYNIGIGRGYSNKEIISEVEKVMGAKLNVRYGDRRPGDAAALFASIDKIKEKLGWEPKYGIKEIVESAYLWHKNNPGGFS